MNWFCPLCASAELNERKLKLALTKLFEERALADERALSYKDFLCSSNRHTLLNRIA